MKIVNLNIGKTAFSVLLAFTFLFAMRAPALSYSTVFDDQFVDSSGTLLSNHNSKWSLVDFEPGTSRWGEYQISNNKASDGPGSVYSSDKLDIALPSQFQIQVEFFYHPNIFLDTVNQHFIDLRIVNQSGNSHVFRFQLLKNGTTLDIFSSQVYTSSLGSYNQSGINTIQVTQDSGIYSASINGEVVFSFSSPDLASYIIMNQSVNSAELTRFLLFDLNSPTPSPTPVPTPTPSPSPTPTLITKYSQRDPSWRDDIYDSAQQWTTSPSFERWGCAVTAASTILDYHGIHALPGGVINNPGNLNAWLTSQDDGFLRAGAVNWNAVARATRLMSAISSTTTLEYKYKGAFPDILLSQLNSNLPVILQEPGHFITAYQYHDDTSKTDIVDPFWTVGENARTTLDSYGNTFLSMRTFTPSNTDLGYIMSIGDSNILPQLLRIVGNSSETTEASVYIQEPIVDPITLNSSSGNPFRVLEYAKPLDGTYELRLHREEPGFGSFETYVYDIDGNFSLLNLSTFFGTDDVVIEIIYRDGETIKLSKSVNFNYLLEELFAGKSENYFIAPYRANDLIEILENAHKLYPKNKQGSQKLMRVFQQLLLAHRRLIQDEYYAAIQADSSLLIQQMY